MAARVAGPFAAGVGRAARAARALRSIDALRPRPAAGAASAPCRNSAGGDAGRRRRRCRARRCPPRAVLDAANAVVAAAATAAHRSARPWAPPPPGRARARATAPASRRVNFGGRLGGPNDVRGQATDPAGCCDGCCGAVRRLRRRRGAAPRCGAVRLLSPQRPPLQRQACLRAAWTAHRVACRAAPRLRARSSGGRPAPLGGWRWELGHIHLQTGRTRARGVTRTLQALRAPPCRLRRRSCAPV